MCGRIVRLDDQRIREVFEVTEFSETRITPRFNIAPAQVDLLIRPYDGGRQLLPSRWGLIPVWAKERSIGAKMFNARAETLTERPAFRNLVGRSRCIVPASGFYEWKAAGKRKTPLYIHRADGEPLAFAGLWTTWRDPDSGETVVSHTVITCAPNDFMGQIHNRMPVILDKDSLEQWLDPEITAADAVMPLLGPAREGLLTAFPVSTAVNNARNDGPHLIEPEAES